MRITDNKRIVNIEMLKNGKEYSNTFFKVDNREYNMDKDAYVVEDIDYCISNANAWKSYDKEWAFDLMFDDVEDRIVMVKEVF